MVTALRELFAQSRTPDHDAKESAAQSIAAIIEQAQAIGRAHASVETHERSLAWGGKFTDILQSAWNIVNTFVQRITDWFTQQEDDVTEEAIEDEVDGLADRVGSFEVAAAIEEEVLRELTFAGVKMVKSEAQPGACEPCVERAERGPVPIDTFEPPPYHGLCRCSTVSADEEEEL